MKSVAGGWYRGGPFWVLADGLRAAVPGLDGYGAVAATGASIAALVAVVLHALEHGGSVAEVRAALTPTLDRLERTMMATSTPRGRDEQHTDADINQHQ
jgi:hypothetical protein